MPVALITGGARGLGKIFSEHFLQSGYQLGLNFFSSKKSAGQLAANYPGKVRLLAGDIRNSRRVNELVRQTIKKFGRIDVVINNAAIVRDRLIVRMSENDWDEVIRTNLTASFYMIREASKFMIKQRSGHIINIASIAGARGNIGEANYAAAKAGLISLTKIAASELGAFNIRVNAVLPGFHLTDMGKNAPTRYYQRARDESVLNKTTDAEELAEFLVFLSRQKTVSGQVFNWDSRIMP